MAKLNLTPENNCDRVIREVIAFVLKHGRNLISDMDFRNYTEFLADDVETNMHMMSIDLSLGGPGIRFTARIDVSYDSKDEVERDGADYTSATVVTAVNWSGCGSQDAGTASAYAELLRQCAMLANMVDQVFGKTTYFKLLRTPVMKAVAAVKQRQWQNRETCTKLMHEIEPARGVILRKGENFFFHENQGPQFIIENETDLVRSENFEYTHYFAPAGVKERAGQPKKGKTYSFRISIKPNGRVYKVECLGRVKV